MRTLLEKLTSWWMRKTIPPTVRGGHDRPAMVDAHRQLRSPSSWELLAELKNTAYACAQLNASVCATHAPRLYVRTRSTEPAARCLSRRLTRIEREQLETRPELASCLKGANLVEEVLDHPLLTLFRSVNPTHNAHDLWELTTLYQEVHGSAYWQITVNDFGVPDGLWILPSHRVTLLREPKSPALLDGYQVQTNNGTLRLAPDEVIHFRYPDPRDPYGPGLSPLRACFESVAMSSEYLAYRRSLWVNQALPSVILSPAEILTEEEAERLEEAWQQRFARGGNGRVLVAESSLRVDVLRPPLADLSTLAEAGATREEIANVFGVPLAFLTTQTNLANLQAAEHQHAALSIRPRLRRRDEKLNEQLIPRFDPSGRLFVASADPVPGDVQHAREQQETDLRWGVRTINEIRSERGLPPVPWGDKPWLPVSLAPSDFPQREDILEESGRARRRSG